MYVYQGVSDSLFNKKCIVVHYVLVRLLGALLSITS
jgi:hypothetical protein